MSDSDNNNDYFRPRKSSFHVERASMPEDFRKCRQRRNSIQVDRAIANEHHVISHRKHSISCALIGDGLVGKTTLARLFTDHQGPLEDKLSQPYVATVFDNYIGTLEFGGKEYQINVLDSSGEHDFNEIRSFCYRKSDVILVCFCKNDRGSFESILNFWFPNVREINDHATLVLVATYLDDVKKKQEPEISAEEAGDLADQIGAKAYLECHISDKNDVQRLFNTVLIIAKTGDKRRRSIIDKIFGK